MLTVFSEKHALRNSSTELYGGQLVAPFECPARAEYVLERLKQVELGEVIAPDEFGIDPVKRIHDNGFIEFLEHCWKEWEAVAYLELASRLGWLRLYIQPPPIPSRHVQEIQ